MMKTIAFAVAALTLVSAIAPAVAFAKEIKAPEGCYIRIDRDGTYVCCPLRIKSGFICRQQTSTIAQ